MKICGKKALPIRFDPRTRSGNDGYMLLEPSDNESEMKEILEEYGLELHGEKLLCPTPNDYTRVMRTFFEGIYLLKERKLLNLNFSPLCIKCGESIGSPNCKDTFLGVLNQGVAHQSGMFIEPLCSKHTPKNFTYEESQRNIIRCFLMCGDLPPQWIVKEITIQDLDESLTNLRDCFDEFSDCRFFISDHEDNFVDVKDFEEDDEDLDIFYIDPNDIKDVIKGKVEYIQKLETMEEFIITESRTEYVTHRVWAYSEDSAWKKFYNGDAECQEDYDYGDSDYDIERA